MNPSPSLATPSNLLRISSDNEFHRWLERYLPVERAILAAREKRVANRSLRARERRRRFGDLCEATQGLAAAWRSRRNSRKEQLKWAAGDWWMVQCLLRYWRLTATRELEALRHEAKRPLHYGAENARRRILAAERHRATYRTTENPCPTREEILEAWIHVRDSHAATIRFGGLIEDLECYLDNSLRRTPDGVIVGRRGGVKRWLQTEIPALYLRYTTVMRYKSAARKLRQLAGARDPVPASRVLDTALAAAEEKPVAIAGKSASTATENPPVEGMTADMAMEALAVPRECGVADIPKGGMGKDAGETWGAVWREVTAELRAGPTALIGRLDELWAKKEDAARRRMGPPGRNEITGRTKSTGEVIRHIRQPVGVARDRQNRPVACIRRFTLDSGVLKCDNQIQNT